MGRAENVFSRRSKLLDQAVERRQEATDKAFTPPGATPYGMVKLKPSEKAAYFMAQPDEKKWELMNQMDETERREMARLLGGG